ncbi:hypothetical protein PVAP13_9KG434085 [Panicum virgatum]|uniref:Uncharacterized protein n=1 Tax=Panicum virgatum TaxID=38727 RepID=A0A8T0NS05_PANVG|nr:hypothetical protein PVAP13_9KG434085 [Panicum virgatum]
MPLKVCSAPQHQLHPWRRHVEVVMAQQRRQQQGHGHVQDVVPRHALTASPPSLPGLKQSLLGVGGDGGGGDAAGHRVADGAVGARGGRRQRVPMGGPHLGGHQTPCRSARTGSWFPFRRRAVGGGRGRRLPRSLRRRRRSRTTPCSSPNSAAPAGHPSSCRLSCAAAADGPP